MTDEHPHAEHKVPSSWLCSPRELTVEIQTNSTADVYILDAEGAALWDTDETLKPLFTFEGVKRETFTVLPTTRGVYSIVFNNPSNEPTAIKVTLTFSGVERDFLLASFIFVGAGLAAIVFSIVLNLLDQKRNLGKPVALS
jgi:hypothetical protein